MIAPNLVAMGDFNFKKDFVKKFRKKFLQKINLEKHVLVGTNKEGLVNLKLHVLQKQKKYLQSVFLKELAQKHHTRYNLNIKTILIMIMKLGSILILKVRLKESIRFKLTNFRYFNQNSYIG